MKMPRVEIGAVQSLGRHDIAAVGAKGRQAGATGQQQQQMVSLMSEVASDYIQRQQNVEYDNAVAQSQIQINNFERAHLPKQFYKASDIPSTIPSEMVQRTDTTFVNGQKVETERDSIPAYEVYPHLLKQELQGMTEVNAEKISNPVLRKEYLRVAQVKNSEMMMTAGIAAEQQQQAFVYAKGVADADAAYKSGDPIAGDFYVDNLVADDNVKAGLRAQGDVDLETYSINQSIQSNNPDVVMTMLHRLDDPQYEGFISEPMRQAAIRDLNARLNGLGANREAESDRQSDIAMARYGENVKTGGSNPELIQEDFEKWVENPDDPDGIDDAHYERFMGYQRTYDAAVVAEDRRIAKENEAAEKAAAVKLTKMEKVVNTEYVSRLDKGIDDGVINEIDLVAANEAYLVSLTTGVPNPESINGSQFDTLRHHVRTRDAKTTASTKRYDLGYRVANGTVPRNRENSDQQAGIDEYVEQSGLSKDIPAMVKIAQDTNIMAQPLEDIIVGGALTQTGEEAVASLTAYGAILDNNLHGTFDLGGKTRELLDDAWYYHRVGMGADEAFVKATEIQQMQPSQREYNQTQYSANKYSADNLSDLAEKMADDDTTRYPFDPAGIAWAIKPGSRMASDYEMIVQNEFERTGNIDQARATGWNALTQVWSPSGVGAKVVGLELEHPARPEKYGVERTLGITTPVALGRLGAFGEAMGVDPKNIVVKGDGYTARQKENVSWSVYMIDPETMMETQLYDKTNKPIRWIPNDWEAQGKEYSYRKEAVKIEAAKKRRESFEDEQAYKLANP